MTATCTCGHPESEHTSTTGPNSIGQRWTRGCTHDATRIGPDAIDPTLYGWWLVGGCDCLTFEHRWWRRWLSQLCRVPSLLMEAIR